MDLRTAVESFKDAVDDFDNASTKIADETFELSQADGIDDIEGARELVDKIVELEPDQGLAGKLEGIADELLELLGDEEDE